MKLAVFACAFLVVFALTGCNSPQSDLMGRWKVTVNTPPAPPNSGPIEAKGANELPFKEGCILTFKEDGTYTIEPHTYLKAGAFRWKEKQLELLTGPAGLAPSFKFNYSKDRSKLYYEEVVNGKPIIVLVKEKK